jgi:hypothetical protein
MEENGVGALLELGGKEAEADALLFEDDAEELLGGADAGLEDMEENGVGALLALGGKADEAESLLVGTDKGLEEMKENGVGALLELGGKDDDVEKLLVRTAAVLVEKEENGVGALLELGGEVEDTGKLLCTDENGVGALLELGGKDEEIHVPAESFPKDCGFGLSTVNPWIDLLPTPPEVLLSTVLGTGVVARLEEPNVNPILHVDPFADAPAPNVNPLLPIDPLTVVSSLPNLNPSGPIGNPPPASGALADGTASSKPGRSVSHAEHLFTSPLLRTVHNSHFQLSSSTLKRSWRDSLLSEEEAPP